MVSDTRNISVTILNMLFTFPFILSFLFIYFLQLCSFILFCFLHVNYNDKCQKLSLKWCRPHRSKNQCYHNPEQICLSSHAYANYAKKRQSTISTICTAAASYSTSSYFLLKKWKKNREYKYFTCKNKKRRRRRKDNKCFLQCSYKVLSNESSQSYS